ncbi:Gx transporter family protein [Tepidibacter mesophilus]|uniref:Gx transporter family protein n=1 Tax=Tepidibacter mesophilus TaxID=655607 RepID=UPI000C07D859|nr:Gx transporter family protein [Tepidibacter mesophilus]
MNKTKKMVFMSILISQSLVMYIIETYIANPLVFIAPGAKLGLSNIITLISLIFLGFKDTFVILIARVIISSILGGGFSAFLYSAAGGVLSLIFMYIFNIFSKKKSSLVGVSIIGAVFHNIGQLIMASIIIHNIGIFIYMPILLFTSIPTGMFIGIVCRYLVQNKNIYKYMNINNTDYTIIKFQRGDYIIILITLVLSIGVLYFNNIDNNDTGYKRIQVVVDNKIYEDIVITNEDYKKTIKIETEKGYNYIYIHDGGVEIKEADCHDEVCVRTGFIDRRGQMIACLPRRLYVKILGEDSQIDNVSY